MIDTIKSYLVSLGFSVDKASYQSATKAMDGVEQGVAKFAGSAVTKFALAGAAVTTFVATASIGIAKFIGDLAQADLETEKLARQLWMSKDAAAAYNNTLKAMGVTLQDLYLSPELMRNFKELNQEAKDLRPPAEFAEQMKLVRSVQFEFTRLKLEATYALQWVGYYFVKYMEGPIKQIKQTLSEINGIIVKTMPSWTKVIAQVMSWFARMGITTFKVLKDIIRIFNDVGSAIPRNLKMIGAAIAALGLIIQTGPFGIITSTLLALILLLDDFYTYLDGGESAFGPFWKKLEEFYNKLKGDGVFDGIQKGWKESLKVISEGIEAAGTEINGFYKDIEDKGVLKNFEGIFKNTFGIIEKLFVGTNTWVQDLFKELEKQGVLKDLKDNFENVIASVSELTASITKVIDKFLGLNESKKVLGGIGDILKDVIVVQMKLLNDLLETSAGYVSTISKAIGGGLLNSIEEKGGEAGERLEEGPKKGFFVDMFQDVGGLLNQWRSSKFSDKVSRTLGLLAKGAKGTEGANGFSAPAYTLPSSNTQNTSNTTNLNPTYNIYGSDPQKTADAAQNNMDSMYTRSMSGVIR
ncbi:hypothetical protein GC093_20485 [Paenibacillus sp. LMG 31456]|uniref:Phage tail tape measure protein n=1 Tax=Paenibacillus foliorum TaxID=2654974 RepID=A0A972K0G4_9BACL|nr:hypothetical protein [Paenibacillus foliorum]NOU95589.1 hypothetical protein [Paenibacillus foliorum]